MILLNQIFPNFKLGCNFDESLWDSSEKIYIETKRSITNISVSLKTPLGFDFLTISLVKLTEIKSKTITKAIKIRPYSRTKLAIPFSVNHDLYFGNRIMHEIDIRAIQVALNIPDRIKDLKLMIRSPK